jgi:hypothetical protein
MENLYRFYFKFYTLTGALGLKFEDNRFKVSKILSLRISVPVVILIILNTIKVILEPSDVSEMGAPKNNRTRFLVYFLRSGGFIPISLIALIMITQVKISEDLAKILNVFLKLKSVLEFSKNDCKNVSIKTLKYFSFFILVHVLDFYWVISGVESFSIKNILFAFLTLLTTISFVCIITLINAFLLHYELVMECYLKTLKKVCEKELDLDKLEIALSKMNLIFNLIQMFNRSISRVLTLIIVFILNVEVYMVI